MTQTRQSGEEHFPILCAACAGPATPTDDLNIKCDFCGKEERLPSEIAERTRELRRRVTAAARSALQLKGLQASMASMFEKAGSVYFAIVPYLVLVAAIVGIMQMQRCNPALRGIPAQYRGQVGASLAVGPMLMLAFPIAILVGWLYARSVYRRKIRPHLCGLPPREPGRPARCRSCCGELADRQGPFVPCTYCGVHNLLSKEWQSHNVRIVAGEEQALRGKTRIVAGKTSAMAANLNRAFGAAFVLVYLLALVAMRLVQR